MNIKDLIVKILAFFNLTTDDLWSLWKQIVIVVFAGVMSVLTKYFSTHTWGASSPYVYGFWTIFGKAIQKIFDGPVKNLTGKQI